VLSIKRGYIAVDLPDLVPVSFDESKTAFSLKGIRIRKLFQERALIPSKIWAGPAL